MRKLIYGINLTLDGCCDHRKVIGSEEVLQYYTNMFREADTLVYGRVTYQLMVPYWSDVAKNPGGETKEEVEFAQAFDSIDKMIVFSKSLKKADERNTSIVNNNLKEEIVRLKEGSGKNILTGGVNIPSQLMQLDLIDEYHFVVQPRVVGEGRRLFDAVGLANNLELTLAGSAIFKSGSVALRYLKTRPGK